MVISYTNTGSQIYYSISRDRDKLNPDSVEEDLKKLDKAIIRKILTRIETYLACDPKELGKPLKGEFGGYWRYHWGDYRVIYKISEREILITVLRISNRKDVYS